MSDLHHKQFLLRGEHVGLHWHLELVIRHLTHHIHIVLVRLLDHIVLHIQLLTSDKILRWNYVFIERSSIIIIILGIAEVGLVGRNESLAMFRQVTVV